jgi:Na+-translocating ferredoxin:NAD+ oxidoreductase RnfE subunit
MFKRFTSHFFHIAWHFRSVIFGLIALIVIGALVIAFVEKMPFGNALYFAFVTGLTIGYGEIVAKTVLGRIVALLIGLIGIIFTGMVVAIAVRAVQKSFEKGQ